MKDLKNGPADSNGTPTVIVFCETSHAGEKRSIEEVLKPTAEKYIKKAKASGDDLEWSVMVATESSGLATKIRGMLQLASLPPSLHEHPLEKEEALGGWVCDGCGGSEGPGKDRHRCTKGCDFDFCSECNAKSAEKPEKMAPRVAILDVSSDGAYYLAAEEMSVGTAEIEQFVDDFVAGKLELKQLQR